MQSGCGRCRDETGGRSGIAVSIHAGQSVSNRSRKPRWEWAGFHSIQAKAFRDEPQIRPDGLPQTIARGISVGLVPSAVQAVMTSPLPRIATRFWLQDRRIGNFGDALNLVMLRSLGFEAAGATAMDTLNRGRCLFAIGSVISDWHIQRSASKIDVWGSGWRGEPIAAELIPRLNIRAVRGPRSAAALGCPGVPLGDPALLLPRWYPRPQRSAGGTTLLIPHYLERHTPTAAAVGCDEVLRPRVRQRGRWIGWSLPTPEEFINQIASADFVLTGALHGAIVAQAYGVPWAAWSGSRIDCPIKWLDWFDYLGIEAAHVTDRRAGERWWRQVGLQGQVRPLEPLLQAFPYAIPGRPQAPM